MLTVYILLGITGILALFSVIFCLFSLNNQKVMLNSVESRLNSAEVSIKHHDVGFLEKILVRVAENETGIKAARNENELLEAKLKSYINRDNREIGKKRKAEAEQEAPEFEPQEDYESHHQQNGHVSNPYQRRGFVRASQR